MRLGICELSGKHDSSSLKGGGWLPGLAPYSARTAEGEGLVGPQPYHFFASVDFLGLQMTWIMYV